MITIYLAGSIRDGNEEDIGWRELFCEAFADAPHVRILNPLAGKSFNAKEKTWIMSGIAPTGKAIVHLDFWAIDNADIVVFNMLSLAEGYPSLGSLIEYGRATARRALIFTVVPKQYKGHSHSIYKLHPFVAETSAHVFHNVSDCLSFLLRHVPVLAGENPWYKGTV